MLRDAMDQDIEDIRVKQELLVLNHQSLRQSNSPLSPLRVSSPSKREADPICDRDTIEVKKRKKGNQVARDFTVNTYEDLFLKEVSEFLGDDSEGTKDFRAAGNAKGDGSTQHGTVRWSPEEKVKFFHHLDRKGRHDLPGISNGIGTKSQPEVADFLHILLTAHNDRHLRSDRLDLYRYEDLPAAIEVGEGLNALLDTAAAKLTDTDLRRSLKREKRKYDDRAIIHYDLVKTLDKTAPDIDSSPPSRGTLDFAITLLNVPQMLELSAYVFMNSKHEHDNWMHIAPVEGVPRMVATCLIDICNLVVSLTERIASSANFLAMSRIRAADSRSSRDTGQIVTRADVLTAVEILNLPPNSWKFWARSPRKCQLRVVLEDRQASDSEEELSYNAVEKTLLQSAGKDPRPMSSGSETDIDDLPSDGSDVSMSPVSVSYRVSRPESRARTSSRSSSHIRHISRIRTSSRTRSISIARSSCSRRSTSTDAVDNSDSDSDPSFDDLERRELADDEFADAVDANNRKSEESMLCRVINSPLISTRDQSNASASTSRTRSQGTLRPRKQAKDLDDWVNWCRYQAKWERYASLLPLDIPAETILREPSQEIGSEKSM